MVVLNWQYFLFSMIIFVSGAIIYLRYTEADGKRNVYTLNLNDINIINSPCYYLQQNDVVYVEPNKVKARNSSVG